MHSMWFGSGWFSCHPQEFHGFRSLGMKVSGFLGAGLSFLGSCSGFNLRYHNKETILFIIDPHYGYLNKILSQESSFGGSSYCQS